MARFNKLFIAKVFAVLLAFLLIQGPASYGDNKNINHRFNSALDEYKKGLFEKAAVHLEAILNLKERVEISTKAKVYLLLGACYEKTGQEEKAKECFLELKTMLAGGVIVEAPEVPGIDPAALSQYRHVFEEGSFIKFKEPVEVSEVLQKKVVHAPRKSKEQKEKEKKKKKFPWLIAIGAVVIIGTAVVILLSNISKDKIWLPEVEWIRIPAGDFLMGDNFNEGEADELPVHRVYLDEYYISKYVVTREYYMMFCEATGNFYPYPPRSICLPAIERSWIEAKAFCDWLSQKTGQVIRLPTEAEWEKAARGTDQRRYPWGNEPPDNDKASFSSDCNYYSIGCVGEAYRPAGESPYGVRGMAGGAAEWCLDWYSSSYYSISPEKNPVGPSSGSFRVVRGGSHCDSAWGIRSARRDFLDPNRKSIEISFRMVKEK